MGYGPYEFNPKDAYDFANFTRNATKQKGDELHFNLCPYCRGGSERKDKNTFSINLKTGQFKCLRSSCGITGNMITLSKDFDFSLGHNIDEYYKPKKQYKQFESFNKRKEPVIPKPEAIQYLESRGISETVAKEYEITVQTDKPNVLVFPFYDEKGILRFVKYRKTDFNKDVDKNKEWCESNCKPILFGMKQCKDFSRLTVCEGQIDSLSVATAGIDNAVSVPTGANGFTWIPYCWDWINKFEEIVVFGDHEKGHITLLDELSKRLKITVKHVREEDYKDCKDANEILKKYGKEQVRKCVENAVVVPVKQVKQLADVKRVDIFKLPKMKTGIKQVDRLLYGGLPFGGVTLISGKTGKGKLLADDTPVFTRNGWKKHGDLVVGDEVIGKNGHFVKVTHIFPKDYANMKITFNNHDVIYCHENHEWVTSLHCGYGYKEKIYEAKKLKEKLDRGYTHPLRLVSRKPLDGTDENLYVKPYTLGTWLGDGRNQDGDISSSEKDVCVIESIINDDGYDVKWKTKHKTTGVLYFSFRGLKQQLQKYGMCYCGRNVEKYIPHEYLVASLYSRLELLAGLLDTDGYYDKVKNSYIYSTCDVRLRDTFVDLIHTFGWNCYYTIQKAHTTTSGIHGRKDCYLIGFTPSTLRIPCRIDRKRQLTVKDHMKRVPCIKKIEYCEEKQGNCIEVEGGIYCVGKTMIPTHNSVLASQIMINAVQQGYKCFAYSGELIDSQFQSIMDFQIAGGRHIIEYQNEWGDNGYNISDLNRNMISDWYRDKFWLYDNSAIENDEQESLVTVTENVIMQYGVKVVLLDNLMTAIDLEDTSGSDKYERQGLFVKKLARLATRHDALILLVAHKRKNNFSTNENDEISGSSDISNLAMVTITYDDDKELDTSQRRLKVSKNRLFGKTETKGYILDYDEKSKRIYGQGDDLYVDYGWNKGNDGFIPINEESPFD